MAFFKKVKNFFGIATVVAMADVKGATFDPNCEKVLKKV